MRRRDLFVFLLILSACTTSASIENLSALEEAWLHASPEAREAELVHQLEIMSLTTSTASMLRAGRSEDVIRLLEGRLASSVDSTQILMSAGAQLPPKAPLPNLRAAPARVSDYAEENNLTILADKARQIAAKLDGTPPN